MNIKRLFLSLTVAATLCGAASAQTLSVGDVEALPGETVAFALNIDVEGGAYSGFQFQMQFPAEGFTTVGTTIASDWDGGSLGVGDLVAGEANASASSMSDTAIPNGERVIGTVKFAVGSEVPIGNYEVTISNFNFLDGTNYTPVADVTFTIHVVNVHSVVLDENSTTMPESATGVNVRVLRTIKADEWSTIVLPFAMTEAQVKAAFGDDVQLAEFKGWETTEYDDDNAKAISVGFGDVNAIAANTPYIIKVSTAISEFTADGVNIEPDDEPAVTVGKKSKGTLGSFTGSYIPVTIEEECLFLSDNQFWYSTGKTKMKGYRAYFYFQDVLATYSNASGTRISMNFSDDETTGISTMHNTQNIMHNEYYNLNGQYVEKPAKGIYVRDGKKYVVK